MIKDAEIHQIRGSPPSLWHLSNAQTGSIPWQSFFVLIFTQRSLRIQLEIHQLRRIQCDDHLPLVRCRRNDCLTGRSRPLVYAICCSDMSQPMRIDLEESRRTELLHSEGRMIGDETSVIDFFDGLANREDKSTVGEGKNDVGIEFI